MESGINYISEELVLNFKGREFFDERNNEFIVVKDCTIRLKHSLISVSKWEAKWKKPFLDENSKTLEETIDYIKFMTITQNVDPNVYLLVDNNHMALVNSYISDSMTATWFNDNNTGASRSKSITTSEIIYYWMTEFNIPWECQKWHLNRLLTLIKVCSIKKTPPKKMGRSQIAKSNRALNASRRKQMNSRG